VSVTLAYHLVYLVWLFLLSLRTVEKKWASWLLLWFKGLA